MTVSESDKPNENTNARMDEYKEKMIGNGRVVEEERSEGRWLLVALLVAGLVAEVRIGLVLPPMPLSMPLTMTAMGHSRSLIMRASTPCPLLLLAMAALGRALALANVIVNHGG